ncbi:MAG: hypothetical protein Q7J79_11535 [Gemmatimonadales bacterium]|nr:hypothetical protein [Gemmatimonadales bacterium]
MPKILFVVHGMGVHGSDWARPVRAKLVEAASRYQAFKNRPPLDQQVEIVPITYDDVLTGILGQWQGSVDGLATFARDQAMTIPTVLNWLNTAQGTEKDFFWTHVVDVLLYRFNSIATKQVRLKVMKAIAAKLAGAMQGGQLLEASVLTHGLGTSVVHDSLAILGSVPLDWSQAFIAGNFRFLNLFAVANVSRVLETDPQAYTSVVHPDTVQPATAYLTRYYNFRHTLDPIPAVRAFKPVNWGDDYRPTEGLDHIREFNVHGYEHYLDAPSVHVPIINGLLGPVITRQEKESAIAAYAAAPGLLCADQVREFAAAARRMIDLVGDSADPEQLIITACQFLALAKEARDACHA